MIKRNPNLRKLAIAYAQGKLDLAEYRKLRTFQLSAVDFGKPSPELPPEYAAIEIPSINIDPPNKPTPRGSLAKLGKIILILVILAAIGGGTYYYFNMENKPPARKATAQKEKSSLTLEQMGTQLSNKRIWFNRDIEEFKAAWVKAGSSKRNAARNADWFAELEMTITDRITETKDLIEAGTGTQSDQELLDNLRLFYAYLKTE